MGEPITWRNVVGPSLADASRPFALAENSFNGAFDILNKAITQRQEAASFAKTKQEEAAKQGYLNDLFAVGGVDNLLQQRQAFMERMQGLTPEAQAGVRGQFDQRVAALRNQATQEWDFTDKALTREQRPIRDGIMFKLYSKDMDGAAADLLANPNLMDRGEVQKTITDYKRAMELQGREDTRFTQDTETHKWKINETQANIAAKNASVNASNASASASQASVAESGLRQKLTQRQLDQSDRADQVDEALSKAFINARGATMTPEGLPNERAMSNAAADIVQSKDPRIAAQVLQKAAESDKSRVDAWRTAEDSKGFVGSAPLNATAVINSLAPEFDKITIGNKGEVGSSITEKIRDGHPINIKGADGKWTKVVLPIPLNVARAALAESDTTVGLGRGNNAVSIINDYMDRTDVQRDIMNRMNAEKLRDNMLKEPSINGQSPEKAPRSARTGKW